MRLNQALDAHNTFVESVRTNLDSLHLQQWFVNADYATNPGGDRTTSKDVFNNGGKVDNNIAFSGFGGSGETKYYFDNDTSTGGINGASNEGDLDAKTGTTTTRYYLFWCDPSGNIRMLTGNTADIANTPATNPYAGDRVCQRPSHGTHETGVPLISNPTAATINNKTLIIDKLWKSLEKGGGNDATATWVADGRF